MIGLTQWIVGGNALGWVSRWVGWTALAALQFLTLFSLRRRLVFHHLSSSWLLLLVMLWIGYDVPLALYRHAYMVLPLGYGISQIAFLFNFRRKD
jgi:hypothetical protein